MGNRNGKFGQSHSHSHMNRTHRLSTRSSERDVSPYYPGTSTSIMHLRQKRFGLTKPSSV